MSHRPTHLSRRQTLCTLAAGCLTFCATAAPTMNALAAAPLTTAPTEVVADLKLAQLRGRAPLRFFGLLVYEARLWALPAFEPERYDQLPFALELEYARKLEGDAIAERSVAEMRRVGEFTEAQSKAWLAFMNQAFPNVGAQDRLTGLHDGAGGVRFFFNGKPTAAINTRTVQIHRIPHRGYLSFILSRHLAVVHWIPVLGGMMISQPNRIHAKHTHRTAGCLPLCHL